MDHETRDYHRLEKAAKFLDFYLGLEEPEAKFQKWQKFTGGLPFNPAQARGIVMQICAGVEDLNWEALDG